MSKQKNTWRAGYADGSGEDIITSVGGNFPVAAVRWGCSCCKATGPLRPEEIERRDKIIRAVNSHDALLAALRESIQYCPYKGKSEETPFLRRARAAIFLASHPTSTETNP